MQEIKLKEHRARKMVEILDKMVEDGFTKEYISKSLGYKNYPLGYSAFMNQGDPFQRVFYKQLCEIFKKPEFDKTRTVCFLLERELSKNETIHSGKSASIEQVLGVSALEITEINKQEVCKFMDFYNKDIRYSFESELHFFMKNNSDELIRQIKKYVESILKTTNMNILQLQDFLGLCTDKYVLNETGLKRKGYNFQFAIKKQLLWLFKKGRSILPRHSSLTLCFLAERELEDESSVFLKNGRVDLSELSAYLWGYPRTERDFFNEVKKNIQKYNYEFEVLNSNGMWYAKKKKFEPFDLTGKTTEVIETKENDKKSEQEQIIRDYETQLKELTDEYLKQEKILKEKINKRNKYLEALEVIERLESELNNV